MQPPFEFISGTMVEEGFADGYVYFPEAMKEVVSLLVLFGAKVKRVYVKGAGIHYKASEEIFTKLIAGGSDGQEEKSNHVHD